MHLATNAYIVTSTLQNIAVAKTVSNLFIDNKTKPISIEDQNITYTTFGKVSKITENKNKLLIEYGFDNQRIYSECEEERVVNKGKGKKEKIKISTKKYYAGSFEEKEIEEKGQIGGKANQRFLYDYISGPDGLAAVFVSAGNKKGLMFYILKDHIGSITGVVDESGKLVAEYSYDAWGKRRNPKTWKYENLTELMFDRGFTGHEHLELFDLINMNGRVYDPSLGRFLSPDNYMQAPDFTQSFNRYSYCFNNPLGYTDPSGEWVQYLIGALIGGITNLATNWSNIDNVGQGFMYFGIGAVSGAVGGTSNGGFFNGAIIGSTTGFVSGLGYGLIQGQKFGDAVLSGVKSGISGGLAGGISGGVNATLDERNFWTGNKAYYDQRLENYERIEQDCQKTDCKNATAASNRKLLYPEYYLMDQKYFRNEGNEFLSIKGNENATLAEYYTALGFGVEKMKNTDINSSNLGYELCSGNPIVINKKMKNEAGTDIGGHTLTLVRMRQWREGGGTTIWFSDPQKGHGVWKANFKVLEDLNYRYEILKFFR